MSELMLVLGSGATVGSLAKVKYEDKVWDPPMDYNFFKTPLVKTILNKKRYPAIEWYQQYGDKVSYEETWSIIDLYHKLALGEVISEERTLQSQHELRERMETRKNCKDEVDISYKNKYHYEHPAWRVPSLADWEFRELMTEVYRNLNAANTANPFSTILNSDELNIKGIITFNYDLMLEQSLEKSEKTNQYFYSPKDDYSNKKLKALYKLHGSLNWEQTKNGIQPPDFQAPRNLSKIIESCPN